MAQRRLLRTVTCQAITALSSNPISLNHILKPSLTSLATKTHNSVLSIINTTTTRHPLWPHDNGRCFSAESGRGSEIKDSEEEDSDAEEVTSSELQREYSPQEKEEEAAAIGYKVIGPLAENERVIKAYEPVFAVVEIGSHQFKVSNGDCIFTERLKFCDVNDKLILNKVLLVGSHTQTIVGRPIVPDAAVHAIVEEHALDAKVIVFKKKRRKNYRRTKGHRQELTKLRITDIQGIEKPEKKVITKHKNIGAKKQEKVPVAA